MVLFNGLVESPHGKKQPPSPGSRCSRWSRSALEEEHGVLAEQHVVLEAERPAGFQMGFRNADRQSASHRHSQSPDGKWLAGASTFRGVQVWEVNTGVRRWIGQTNALSLNGFPFCFARQYQAVAPT
jgi:hypothetical protein